MMVKAVPKKQLRQTNAIFSHCAGPFSRFTLTPVSYTHLDVYKRQVFAQLERETIQKRVTDAYYSRSQRGFKMGGKAPYGTSGNVL